MNELLAYEARELNRDPRRGALINVCFCEPSFFDYRYSYMILQERLFTIYSMEGMSKDMYNALDMALKAAYN